MGKWASYSHKGGSASAGFLAAPGLTDWNINTVAATSFFVTRTATIPTGADRMQVIAVDFVTRALVFQTSWSAASVQVTGLTTVTPYNVYVRWMNGTIAVSDWGPLKTQVTS